MPSRGHRAVNGVGAAVRDGPVADGAANRLFALARFAHANGHVTASRHEPNLRALVGQVPGYGIDAEGRIVLDESSGQHAIDVFSHLFYHLYEHAKLPGMPVAT